MLFYSILTILFCGFIALGIIGFIYLYINNFRIKYMDLKSWFSGKKKACEVGAYYDVWFERYKEVYGDTIQSYRSEHLELLHDYVMKSAGLKDGMLICDAGCGVCGPDIYFASKLDIRIEALNISEKQVLEAKENIEAKGLSPKINVQKADYQHLNKLYPENYFDAIIFLESFGHAQNPKKLLHNAAKVLKDEGIIYIKDYFKKDMPKNVQQKKLIRMGVRNMDKIYFYNTPDLYYTIYLMRQLNFELRWLKIPEIPQWDMNKVIQEFHIKNNIAFYNDKDELFDQNNGRFIVDPYEMFFVKNKKKCSEIN